MDRTDWIIVGVAFLVFTIVIRLEISWWRRRGIEKFDLRDSLVNYSLVAMQFLCGVLGKSLFIVVGLEWFRERGPHSGLFY